MSLWLSGRASSNIIEIVNLILILDFFKANCVVFFHNLSQIFFLYLQTFS